MTDLPEPLTPADCDLRDFAYMPLDVRRLRDSDMPAVDDAEAFRAAVLLWCAAWHQLPAASVPDDDAALCRLAGYGRDMKTWRKAREGGALRGFVLCSDGRLYHETAAEKALNAWAAKQAQRQRTKAARKARARNRRSTVTDNADQSPIDTTKNVTLSVTETATDNVTSSKGEGKGKGREDKGRKKDISDASHPPPTLRVGAAFEEFWTEYPRKIGKDGAARAYASALKRASAADILAAVRRAQWRDDPKFIPYPQTWLNQGRWQDDPAAMSGGSSQQPREGRTSYLLRELGLDADQPPQPHHEPAPQQAQQFYIDMTKEDV